MHPDGPRLDSQLRPDLRRGEPQLIESPDGSLSRREVFDEEHHLLRELDGHGVFEWRRGSSPSPPPPRKIPEYLTRCSSATARRRSRSTARLHTALDT